MPTGIEWWLVLGAAMAAGLVNALAGGGTLITFPTLMAVGLPAIAANVTNTVALCPGYLGATAAQARDLQDQQPRLWLILPAAVIGGLVGGFLLLNTGERLFRTLIPYLILLASGLLAAQDHLRAWLVRRAERAGMGPALSERWIALPVALAAIYGGYFGAGLSVIVLAVLGLVLEDSLTRLNALKQAVALGVNTAAALFFVFSGQVIWPVALVMAVGAWLGGMLGGKLARRIAPQTLRWIVVSVGVCVALLYWIRE